MPGPGPEARHPLPSLEEGDRRTAEGSQDTPAPTEGLPWPQGARPMLTSPIATPLFLCLVLCKHVWASVCFGGALGMAGGHCRDPIHKGQSLPEATRVDNHGTVQSCSGEDCTPGPECGPDSRRGARVRATAAGGAGGKLALRPTPVHSQDRVSKKTKTDTQTAWLGLGGGGAAESCL